MIFKDILLPPNLITLFRFFVTIYLFYNFDPTFFDTYLLILVISLIGISDSVDGIIARKYNMVSKLGIVLDPFTDRVVFLFLLFWLKELIPTYLIYSIVFREILILIGSIFVLISKRNINVSKKGKLSTVLLFIILCLNILNNEILIVLINQITFIVIVFYFYVAIEYLLKLVYKYE